MDRLLRGRWCRGRHPPTPHAIELIDNGRSIEVDAVLGLTARIQRFGGYATDEERSRPSRSTPATTVRIFAIDLVQELVRTGRA